MKNTAHRCVGAPTALALMARHAGASLIGLGLLATGPAWSMDLNQAYEAAYANDANIRASRAGAASAF